MSFNPDQPRNPDGTWASEGAAVSITGNVEGRGKRGVISQVSPSGKYAGVSTAAGKHLGYYSLSDLSPAKTRVRAVPLSGTKQSKYSAGFIHFPGGKRKPMGGT